MLIRKLVAKETKEKCHLNQIREVGLEHMEKAMSSGPTSVMKSDLGPVTLSAQLTSRVCCEENRRRKVY